MTESNGRIKLTPGTAFQILAYIVAILLAYGFINAQIAVQNAEIQQLKSDVQEIRGDVKTLLYRTAK